MVFKFLGNWKIIPPGYCWEKYNEYQSAAHLRDERHWGDIARRVQDASDGGDHVDGRQSTYHVDRPSAHEHHRALDPLDEHAWKSD